MRRHNVVILLMGLVFIWGFSSCANSSDKAQKNNKKYYIASTNKKQSKPKTPAPAPRAVLKEGDKGDDVKNIQKKINTFGYHVGTDSQFGEETIYAVMDFQHRHGLSTSGVVEGDTLKDLNEKPTADVMYIPHAESALSESDVTNAANYESIVNAVDLPTYTNYLIRVSIAQQTVYIFNGTNRNWKLIDEFSCSSGTSGTPTITGNFFVGNKGPQFSTPNGIVCKYFTQIQGNYLFHSVLFDKNGNLVDGTLGNGVSHGCVRLALENAKYIYDNVPIGSGIWIQ